MSLINNLSHVIKEGRLDIKRELIGVMFPEKFEFDGETYRTNSYNKVLDLIYLQTNELRGQNKRDSSDFPEKSLQVPPQGLDCATCRCAVVCSKVYTLPTSLKGRRSQGSRSKRVHKKKEKIFIFPFPVPPQGLEPWTPTLRVSCSTN